MILICKVFTRMFSFDSIRLYPVSIYSEDNPLYNPIFTILTKQSCILSGKRLVSYRKYNVCRIIKI